MGSKDKRCVIGRAVSLAMWKLQLRADGMEHVPSSHMLLYGRLVDEVMHEKKERIESIL